MIKPRYRFSGLMMALICAVLVFSVAHAASSLFGFAPQSYKNGYTYGNGVYFAPYEFQVHAEPNLRAPVLKTFRWSHKTQSNSIVSQEDGVSVAADRVFFCFYPQLDVAMMAVAGDTEDGWVEVVYDQARHKTGWVKLKTTSAQSLAPLQEEPPHFGLYQTWQEFMRLNAKANGIYWLSGVQEYQRSVRFSNSDDAKMIPVTIIRDIKVKHVRGNWLLVEVLDFERNTPLGWVRWRDDNGNLMVFPNISGAKTPIVTTAF